MGGGQQQAQAPQYDPSLSREATRDELQAKYDFMPLFAEKGVQLDVRSQRQKLGSIINTILDPGAIYEPQIQNLQEQIDNAVLTGASSDTIDDLKKRQQALKDRNPVDVIRNAYAEPYATADRMVSEVRSQADPSAQYTRAQQALREGITARTASAVTPDAAGVGRARDVEATRLRAEDAKFVEGPGAAMAGKVGDVNVRSVETGRLGETLMAQAMRLARSDGQLSREASRDAVQAARRGMADRGMATGSAGLAAELLNRDRYSRQRQAEDMAFAQGVQSQDIGRQFQNVGNQLNARLANQQMAGQLSLADQAATNQMRGMRYQGAINQNQFNANQENEMRRQYADNLLRASAANQGADQARNLTLSGNQQQANVLGAQLATQNNQFNAQQRTGADMQNIAFLQAGSAMTDQERARQVGALQNLYNFQIQSDPRNIMLGLSTPFANMVGPAMQTVSNAQFTPMYSGGQFSSGNQGMNMMAGGLGGALSGAAAGTMVNPGLGTAIGGALGLGAGLLGSYR